MREVVRNRNRYLKEDKPGVPVKLTTWRKICIDSFRRQLGLEKTKCPRDYTRLPPSEKIVNPDMLETIEYTQSNSLLVYK